MQQFWTAFLTTLTFLALATSDQLILEITDDNWSWISIPPTGVSRVSVNANLYPNDELRFKPVPLFRYLPMSKIVLPAVPRALSY